MKVTYLNVGILKNEIGELFECDVTGYGDVMSLVTGELYKITRRDDNDYPIEIKPL